MIRELAIVSMLFSSGCALLSKADPVVPRYFSPERAREARPSSPSELSLRLGAITSGNAIKQNFAYRSSDYELVYSDDHRWTEKPDVYLRRGLARALFEDRGVHRIVSGPSVTLEIELLAFEEIRVSPNRFRIHASVILHDERSVISEQTIAIEQTIAAGKDKHIDDVLIASSTALESAIDQIAARVVEDLQKHRDTPPKG